MNCIANTDIYRRRNSSVDKETENQQNKSQEHLLIDSSDTENKELERDTPRVTTKHEQTTFYCSGAMGRRK